MMGDEEWVKAAMADDSMVVEMLVRLIHAVPPPKQAPPPVGWTVRQRRSKAVMLKPNTARASPTTPLSWSSSGGGGGAAFDGFEESSRPDSKDSSSTRSKVTRTSPTTTPKRSKKKKTLAELKEEEVLLIKERRHLKRELAALRISLGNQRATNERLKRMKLDLQPQPEAEIPEPDVTKDGENPPKVAAAGPRCPILPLASTTAADANASPQELPRQTSCSKVQKEVTGKVTKFVLPDLNLPLEEDVSSKILDAKS